MTTCTRPLAKPFEAMLRDAPIDFLPIVFCSDVDSEISPESDSPEDRPSEPVEIEDRPSEPVVASRSNTYEIVDDDEVVDAVLEDMQFAEKTSGARQVETRPDASGWEPLVAYGGGRASEFPVWMPPAKNEPDTRRVRFAETSDAASSEDLAFAQTTHKKRESAAEQRKKKAKKMKDDRTTEGLSQHTSRSSI